MKRENKTSGKGQTTGIRHTHYYGTNVNLQVENMATSGDVRSGRLHRIKKHGRTRPGRRDVNIRKGSERKE